MMLMELEPVRHEVGTDLCLFQFLLFIFFVSGYVC